MELYYQDKLVTIYHMDCREFESKVDLIIADPPYDFNHNTMETYNSVMANPKILFYPPENQWIGKPDQVLFWIKPISTKNTSRRYSRFVEMIGIYGTVNWNTERHWSQYTNIFTDIVDNSFHPNSKPESLLTRLVKNHTNPFDRILDPFMGSGTTLVVAKRLGRKAIGIEIDEHFCEIAANRCAAICGG
jgi:DNA modification methylase